MKKNLPVNNQIDREQWSESSKRSYVYHYQRQHYEDIPYVCRRCRKACVFTGADQKIAFEIKKQYISQRRTLCGDCHAAFVALRDLHRAMELKWAAQKVALSRDLAFMEAWRNVLVLFPEFGSRIGGNMTKRLAVLIGEVTASTP
ncbi:zinc-ribbon domain containing protein [Roseateles depolymerans]|uniref:Uncharacterized protein n=1 Tax=Roseateles depolymerans TaxID=76731 RepID=A0A0U3D1M6_9BURK|nr:zinc-ribbon domain containing protein [Roseateles depolymerans]ALV07510.1 hypothetical protein RD2015_3049 [Roseateles depolymerans]REG22274.1 hypothetical protein DES44_1418 [Roseateles depolymerans]